MQLILSLSFFLGIFEICTASKILVAAPMPTRSHHNLMERLAIELTRKGHDVTYITAFKQSKPVPKLKEVILPNLYQELRTAGLNNKEVLNDIAAMRKTISKWTMVFVMPKRGPIFMDTILSTKEMQDFLKSDEKFDLIIGENFLDECFLAGLSQKYKAPVIAVATFMPNLWVNSLVGNPAPSAYVPNSFLGFHNKMNFWERLENFVFNTIEEFNYRTFTLKEHDQIMRKYFGNDLPPIEKIIKNTSLVLVNHHYSLAFPRPYLPNMVEIGGYHVPPPKPLPADLQKYFDESKHGVILFSMGSHLKSAQLPVEMRKSILRAFSKLKQDVLWKFEDDTMPDLPKNVKISKWLPQSDILAHPNLKLFITHGGLLSTTEAITRGVPIIGIPVLGDQPLNMKYNTGAGFGLSIDFDELNEDNLYSAIVEILNNSKYKESVQRGSKLIQDTPLPALDTAIYWIEYVVRHKGAPHLRSAAQDLEWYQLYLLDVLGFIFISSAVSILVICRITKFFICCIARLFSKKSTKIASGKKRN